MPRSSSHSRRGAALIIVLAFVVLLTGLSVAYFSRSISDRQIAHSSFNQSNADQLASSAVAIIIGDLRQEIANGSASPAPTFGSGATIATVYTPTTNANMLPMRSGKPPLVGGVDPIPNLVRRSVANDGITVPGLPSRAIGVNSTTNPSANGRSVTKARWNKHYLIPKANASDDSTDPRAEFDGFTPDWVMMTAEQGATLLSTPSRDANNNPVTPVGRYAYAVYDEGALLDINVAGYPNGTTTTQAGRKGSVAFANLEALPSSIPNSSSPWQIDKLVGWRNYGATQPNNDFPDADFAANFRAGSGPASEYWKSVTNNRSGFLSVSGAVAANGRTDQMFLTRQQLIAFRKTTQFSSSALQYLTTFSRESNSPSFSPPTPPGSTIDYAALATTLNAVNPNFLLRRVTDVPSGYKRFDGTTPTVGEPLIKTRFPLSRLAWITYKGPSASLATTDSVYTALINAGVSTTTIQAGTAANVKRCFGLTFGINPGDPWAYTNPTGTATATGILRLDEVATAGREPDFFELLQAGILSGSLGQSTAPPPGTSGGGVTGGNVFPDIHMNNTAHHILSIGAAIIDQADPDSVPTRLQFSPSGAVWTAYGVENLPYVTQLYPIAGTSPNDATKWATYLLFQLWNPHQNAASSTPSVRLRLDGTIGLFKGGNGESWNSSSPAFANTTNQSITVNPASFVNPTPVTTGNVTAPVTAPGTPGTFSQLVAPVVP
ncbi:MAG: hypothetical protein H0W34_02230 [Pyrinomonadaceae bacterium]|nr:hypothetical protein [Pyrinomonadaceae bacterium]